MAIGLYIIGARGNVATLAAAGWAALVDGAWDQPTGLVTALPEFADAGLPALADFAFGGCDVSVTPLAEKAAALADAQMLPARVVSDVAERLAQISAHVDRVEPLGAGKGTLAARLNHYCKLLDAFRARERVSRVIVINLASTEPSLDARAPHLAGGTDGFLASLESAAEPSIAAHPVAGNGMLWAAAAFISNCAFVNFTPSRDAPQDRSRPHVRREKSARDELAREQLSRQRRWPRLVRPRRPRHQTHVER
jgi:myo-inositol-1-phosphate synthase